MRILLLFLLLCSCSRLYIANGIVHNPKVPIKVRINSSGKGNATYIRNEKVVDSTVYYIPCDVMDTLNCISYLENEQILMIGGFYYVLRSKRNKYPEYVNRCVNF